MTKTMTRDTRASALAKNASRKPINRRFASTAFGEGYGDMTPAQRAARKAWLESSYARERQLIETAGQSMRGYADAPLRDKGRE